MGGSGCLQLKRRAFQIPSWGRRMVAQRQHERPTPRLLPLGHRLARGPCLARRLPLQSLVGVHPPLPPRTMPSTGDLSRLMRLLEQRRALGEVRVAGPRESVLAVEDACRIGTRGEEQAHASGLVGKGGHQQRRATVAHRRVHLRLQGRGGVG